MDEALHGAQRALELIAQYPDAVSVVLGTLAGYVLTVMVETYFLPTETDAARLRRQKGLTFLFCWLASGAASSLLWSVLDPKDARGERIIVSYVVGVFAFAGYPFLAKVATSLWPRIGSAWSAPVKPP